MAVLAEDIAATQPKDVKLSVVQIRAMLEHDPEFFIQFFLGSQLVFPVPEFHKMIFRDMTHNDVSRLAVAIPRAHAKTTLMKLTAIWYLLFSPYRFVLYVSGSHDLVVPYVNDIVALLDTPNFEAVFGKIEWIKRQDGVGIYKFYIPVLDKTCILRGLGSGQRVRGINVDNERPEVVLVDDAEDNDDVKNQDTHEAMLDWWFGPFILCLRPRFNKVIVSGNLISELSLLYKFLQSPEWHSYLYGCITKTGEPLWPDVWPIGELQRSYREYAANGKREKWFAEMMNMPMRTGGDFVHIDKICYRPLRLESDIEYGFITIDPAISQNSWADDAAIAAHGWIKDTQQWQIVETKRYHGANPTQLFFYMVEMANRWGIRIAGVETGAMQGGIKHHFDHLKMLNNMHGFDIVELKTYNVKKTERILTWAAQLQDTPNQSAMYAINEGDFMITQELISYNPSAKSNKDNVIDCCAYGVQMTSEYMHLIVRQKADMLPMTPITTLEQMAEC